MRKGFSISIWAVVEVEKKRKNSPGVMQRGNISLARACSFRLFSRPILSFNDCMTSSSITANARRSSGGRQFDENSGLKWGSNFFVIVASRDDDEKEKRKSNGAPSSLSPRLVKNSPPPLAATERTWPRESCACSHLLFSGSCGPGEPGSEASFFHRFFLSDGGGAAAAKRRFVKKTIVSSLFLPFAPFSLSIQVSSNSRSCFQVSLSPSHPTLGDVVV